MSSWFLVRDGQVYGPYPFDRLRAFAESGHIVAHDRLIEARPGINPTTAFETDSILAAQLDGLFVDQPFTDPIRSTHPPQSEPAYGVELETDPGQSRESSFDRLDPYRSPRAPSVRPTPESTTNIPGTIGFGISIVSLLLMCIPGVGMISLAGLILSVIGLQHPQRGLAVAGTILGLITSLVALRIFLFMITPLLD